MMMDAAAGELYVADGYGNRRVVVFDATTGAYKRHWGAYGETPSDDKQPPYEPNGAPSRQFGNPVHCVRLSNDGRVYVCDRVNNRIQVFGKDGKFVQEFRVEPQTRANGSVWDMVLSHDAGAEVHVRRRRRERPRLHPRARERPTNSAASAAPAAWQASSSGCTTSPSTVRATCTPPKSGLADVRKNSPSCRSSLYCKFRGAPRTGARAPCIKGT